jgi:hypothetical protein
VSAEGGAPATNKTKDEAPAPKRLFSFNDYKRTIQISVDSRIYPDCEPWGFKLRMALSKDVQRRREEWLGLPVAESEEKRPEQVLDEVCDLLAEVPTGFAELDDKRAHAAMSPGQILRNFYNNVKAQDAEKGQFLFSIIEAAHVGYWNVVTPRAFLTPLSDSSS